MDNKDFEENFDAKSDVIQPNESDINDVNELDAQNETVDSEESYDTVISGIGVNYENNDNWQFEANAETLEDDFLELSIDENNAAAMELSLKNEEQKPAENFSSSENTASEEPEKPGKKNADRSIYTFVPVALFVAVCIALVSIFSVQYFTVPNGKDGKYANPGSVVATIGNTKITAGMFNYYYSAVVQYYEQYAAYGYYELNTSADLTTQYTNDDDGNKVSWAKFFENEVFEEIERTVSLYEAACEKGITMSSAQKALVDQQLDSMAQAAASSEPACTLDEYLTDKYGEYCTENTIRLMLEQYYVSTNYIGYLNSQEYPSDEKINSYFEEHKSDFETITFSYLAVEYDTSSDEASEKSVKLAESYNKKITDRDSIIKLIPEAYAEFIESAAAQIMEGDSKVTKKEAIKQATEDYISTADYTTNSADSPFDEETTKWLFSDDTVVGEKRTYNNPDAGYIYIILKTEKPTADTEDSYSVRHILIMPRDDEGNTDTSGDTKFTDKQWAAAKKTAEDILKEFNKGDKSEYSFALLSEEHSDDVASTSSSGTSGVFGGLCAATKLGRMVPEFEEWSVDKSRKYGDTGIVKSKYGYHIMFFVNNNCEAYKPSVVSAMRNDQIEKIVSDTELKVKESNIKRLIDEFTKKKANSSVNNLLSQG